MTIRTHVTCRAAVLASLLALSACGGTDSHGPGVGTETDNPSPGTPKYESPGSFSDDNASGVPPCPPRASVGKPSHPPLWGQDGALLIGADRYRGLVAVDTSDHANPQLRSVTPLAGEAHQLIVESNAQVTLAIDEVLVGTRDAVPTPDELQPVARLVRFDASDARAVARVADIDLEGEFWSMRQRGSTLWVMSETVVEPVTSCNRSVYDCGYVDRTALIVAGYRMEAGAWQRVARTELKTTGPAWALPDGYAAFEARTDESGDPAPSALRFVRFDGDDALSAPGEVTIPGEVVPGAPIGLTDALVHVVVLDYQHGNSELDTIALDDGELLSKLDDLQQQQFDYSVFAGDRLIVDGENSGDAARVIDWSDPRAPTSHSFPNGVTRVIPLGDGTRALGLNRPAPDLRASLFTLQNPVPELLDEVTVNQGDGAQGVEDVSVNGDRIVIGYRSSDDKRISVVLAATDTTLERVSSIDAGYGDDVLISGDAFYAPDWSGLHAGSASGGDAHTLTWSRDVTDELSAGAYRATLIRNIDGNVLEVSRDGTLVRSIEVGPQAERLIADDERVLVLSLEPRDQCEQSGFDCSDYTPNVAIVTLGDAPAIAATVKITDPEALGPTAKGENRIQFDIEGDVALALGHGRFVLVASYAASCWTEDECADLGVQARPANQVVTDPSPPPPCTPGASCPPPAPAPAPAPAQSVYGERRATRLYLLDASASEPRLAAAVDSVLELGDSRFASPRVSAGTLMITRIERRAVTGTASGSQPARFMLDRFVIEDGKLQPQTPINVPGFPLALADEGSILFSAEPDSKTQGAGTLHMLELADDAANSLDTAPLDASYSDAIAAFGKIFYLRHDGVDCDGNSTLVAFAMPDDRDGELGAPHAFELPGGRYRIADARDERLLLTDDAGHYVVLVVSGATPKLVKFVSAPFGTSHPALDGDSIVGGASFYIDELSFGSECGWPARLDRGDDAPAGACHAKRHLLTCSLPDGATQGCLSDDTLCEIDLGATACEDVCKPDEYAIGCGGIGPNAGMPDPPPECHDAQSTPGGTVFMCCPCG